MDTSNLTFAILSCPNLGQVEIESAEKLESLNLDLSKFSKLETSSVAIEAIEDFGVQDDLEALFDCDLSDKDLVSNYLESTDCYIQEDSLTGEATFLYIFNGNFE